MATLFIDYENGNDHYGGTSFSVLASGTDGRISTNTLSSISPPSGLSRVWNMLV